LEKPSVEDFMFLKTVYVPVGVTLKIVPLLNVPPVDVMP
jgi:hypothetical protein